MVAEPASISIPLGFEVEAIQSSPEHGRWWYRVFLTGFGRVELYDSDPEYATYNDAVRAGMEAVASRLTG